MERAGLKLKRTRERLKLTYREVEEASQQIAEHFGNSEFAIALSRLADIENKGTAPSIYRLYALCAIYRLDFDDVLAWYGAPLDQIESVALRTGLAETHVFQIKPRVRGNGEPPPADFEIDPSKTVFLSQMLRTWGSTPFRFLEGPNPRRYRYGMIGLADRSMYPILHPGSLVLIDDRARIASPDWTSEMERPIYFFQHREGYVCGWCDLTGDRLVVLPHPSSLRKPSVFRYPTDIDLVGQVVGAFTIWDRAKRSQAPGSVRPKPSNQLRA
jgi:transcriptional regulator with XRE-family HTH domain